MALTKWGIRRLTEDDILDFFDPQQNQNSYQSIKPIMDVPEAVEVVSRSSETMDYVFLLNLENKINQVKLPERAYNFISNQEEEGLLSLKPLDVAVLKIPKV